MKAGFLFATVAAAALAGCAAGPAPDVATPTPVLPEAFYFSPGPETSDQLVALLPIEDPAFDSLAAQALASSPRLAEAVARIEQARSGARRAGAERLPYLGADASISGRRTNPAQFGADLPAGVVFDTERVAYAANLSAAWDVDLFGRIRAQERAALARVDAANASAAAVRIALIAEIAGSVIDWRTLAGREAEIRRDLASAEELVRLTAIREEAGIAPGFDSIRAKSSADASQSRLAAVERERALLIGRLVTLTAQSAPQIRAALVQEAPASSKVSVPASLPSELLANRPDVLAASADLAAADAELAATARKRFPTFSLSAALGLLSFGIDDLFDAQSDVGTLAGGIAGPLFDFGRIEAEIDGAAAEKSAAFQRYRAAVYRALGDAEAGYGLVAAADREADAAAKEAASLQRAAKLANIRYESGLADFLTVLEARRAADASGERAAAALGRAQRARVILWQSLGGSELP